jgi:hypothetical protein
MNDVLLDAATFDGLFSHVESSVEEAAFMLADPVASDMHVRSLTLLQAHDFDHQSAYHLALTDEARQGMIRAAHEGTASVIEVHSHQGHGKAQFSFSDLRGFAEWVPHLWWRLGGRPYAAIVLCAGTFDGLIWRKGPDKPEQLERIEVADGRSLEATALTLEAIVL